MSRQQFAQTCLINISGNCNTENTRFRKAFFKYKTLISLFEMDFISVFDMKEQVQVLDPATNIWEDARIIGFEGSFGI